MKKLAFTLAVGFASFAATATQTIYDTDGNAGRVTNYDNAAVDALVTQSSSAYDLSIYTPHFTNPAPCQAAGVYDVLSQELITTLNVSGKTLWGQLPKGYENRAKYVEATCTDEQGNRQALRHNLAAAPQLAFTSTINVSNWVDSDGFGPGYFQDVTYQGQLNVDNGEPGGFCQSTSLVGQSPKLLNERHNTGFYSDVVSAQGEAKYSARSGVLVNEVICKSTGGTTRAVEVWYISENQQNREITVETF
ncbi:hypothetical protein ACSLBF_19470 (plasmid) [Pseudoalteromonas sp. T1lg65]|uniref:hypothetical protein n=1 Tax=Pseudoalteromonas sp. T1lg65 TaxID=2077101 RepID=UPI003F7976B2